MAVKTTLSDYLAELGVDMNNMQEFLNKLSQMLTTNSDTVNITQVLQTGGTKTFEVPSFAYLKNKVNSIDAKFTSLLVGNANRVGVMDENGQLKTFELQDISQVIADLDSVSAKTVPNPQNFAYKTNWFFESFLNPLIYTDLPVDALVTPDIDKFEVKRVIVTSQVQTNKDYFDSTYKGQNNISYTTLINDLNVRAIQYFEDSNEISLPPSQNKKSGAFDILNILVDSSSSVVMGEVMRFTVTNYVLNTLRYTENSADSPNGLVSRTLKVGDYLITTDNSEYRITAVDVNQTMVTLTRTFGLGDLSIGSNQLRIRPQIDPVATLSVNLGYNERQVIFLKPISTRLRVTTENWSQGFGIYSNDLTITMENGESMTMQDFYTKFVSDFGMLFLNYAKDKKLPSSLGEIPAAPTLETGAFTVVQADLHIQESDDIKQVKQNIAAIEQVKSQINEVDRQISDKRAELNTNASLSQSQQLKLSKDLSSLSDNRKTLTTQHSSKISSVTTAVKAVPNLTATPKYMVKGFWHIPDTKSTMYGDQNVVQFKIAYRILSKTGTAEKVEQITFTDPSGNKIVGAFSPWKETLSKVRGKIYNTATGFYQWAPEKISDPNTVNINQVEIPISKGQVVEVRVKSLSEAGFPDSPVESEWSNSILVEFPASLQSLEDISIISQQAFAEEAKISFQEDLNSKGLDLHLGTAFTSRDKYFAHKTDDIASGFFSSDGSIVDLYTKLKTISDSLAAVQTAIASGAGQLKVSIIDPNGNQISVTNGQTVQLFAGYYKDLIKNNSSKSVQYEHGKIISAQYYIQLENTSQTNLELISVLTGGLGETAPVSIPTQVDPYNTSLRYDKVPISIASSTLGNLGSFNQSEGLQSAQVKGQIIYSRANTVGLADRLVAAEPINTNSSTVIEYIPSSNYSYKGAVKNKTTMPYDSGHYVPYNPTLKAITYTVANVPKVLSVSPSVWNGVIDTSNSPIGGGLLTEFCISIDHPDIKAGGKYNKQWPDLYRPIPILASGVSLLLADSISLSNTKQPTLPFSHGAHFEITQNELVNPLGAKYYQQAAYFKPLAISSANGTTVVTSDMREKNYPIKTSFSANDQYLIGKYTCGAYMYIAPASYSAIGATSFSPIAVKATVPYGTTSAIKIPLIFQYRCSDYLKYIGGFRADATGGLQNVKYAKKLGFDIGLKNDMFSFDVEISAQYEKETAVLTPFTVTQSSVVVNNALTA